MEEFSFSTRIFFGEGALERLRQGLFIRQAHTAIGIDNVATQRQLITQIVKYLRHFAGGAELQPAGFRMQVKIATPFGASWLMKS